MFSRWERITVCIGEAPFNFCSVVPLRDTMGQRMPAEMIFEDFSLYVSHAFATEFDWKADEDNEHNTLTVGDDQ